MAKRTSIANGKTVHRSGGMPDARMGKEAKRIYGGKVSKVHRTVGGVVHATSSNYGHGGAKGRQLHGTNLYSFEDD